MSRSMIGIWLILFCMVLAGCKKEDPNPELLDPIYKDLEAKAAGFEKDLEEELKKQADISRALEKAEPNSTQLRNARRDLSLSVNTANDLRQKGHYFKIRAQRRLLVDRITYKAAFAKGKPWPDSHEYSDYQVNNRLRSVNLNWNSRVPKLLGKGASTAIPSEKAKDKSAKAEE